MSDESTPRPGSAPDLSRRLDRIEQRQDNTETEVRTLSSAVSRVESNQNHAAELNKLRFDALETGINGLTSTLGAFMSRVEGLITGEIQTAQSKAGQELVADYYAWRKEVDEDREAQAVLNGQVRLLGKLAVVLVGTNALTILVAIGLAVRAAMTATTGG